MDAGRTCLRCGAPYEPDDTVCYACGAPIGETQGDTAPVKAIRRPAAALSDDSTVAESSGAPPEVDLSRITVGSMPAVRPSEASAPSAHGAHRGRGWVLALVAGALLVAVAAVAGALYAGRAFNTAPPVTHETIYRDPGGRFHFTRPTLWTVSPAAGGLLLTDSDGASSLSLSIVTPGVAGVAADAKTYADHLAGQSAGQPLAPLRQRVIAGAAWEQREGQVTGADGAVRETLLLVTVHDGDLYVITCTSPVASFDATNNLVFSPLLDSFAFDS
ncbi:MAG: zinc ribbon domain-containing protein [Ktedonobacterales bacterium]